jgi:hypothetical protein
MALVTKTTWWGFGTDTADVADATLRTFASQTVYAETNSRVFKSAIVEVYYMDRCTLTGATVTEARIGVNVGGAGYTTVTETDDLTHSGENNGCIFAADFTAQFTDNFGAGASAAVLIQMYIDLSTGTTLTTNNCCALLKLTYEHDDGATNCLKTMVIPLESSNGTGAPTSLTELGTNQIPIITGASGIIKDCATATIRDYFFIIEGNENNNAATVNFNNSFRIDSGGATFTGGTITRVFGSDKPNRYIWSLKGGVPDTTVVHQFQWMSSVVTSFHHLTIKLVVTYEVVRANCTGTSVSVQIPFRFPDIGATTTGDQQVVRIPIDIQEPGTVTLRQSGVQIHWDISSAMTTASYISAQVGSQTARAYTSNIASGSLCGELMLLQRFDSGSAGGSGASLARGQSYVDVKMFTAAARAVAGFSGIMYLNYSTDSVPATGIDTANHTIWKNLRDWEWLLSTEYQEVAAVAPAYIAETYYWIQNVSAWMITYFNGTTGTPWHRLFGEVLSGEGVLSVADGWKEAGDFTPAALAEAGHYEWAANITDWFKRHPSDPKPYQMDVETSRKWRIYSPRSGIQGQFCTTYHSIRYTNTRAVTGYTGTGAVPVKLHDYTNGEMLYEVTAAVGGVYTYLVYDNTRQLVSRTYESASGKSGASVPWTAS